MKTIQKLLIAIWVVGYVSINGCAEMSTQDKNTAIGATVGGVAGAVLTGGSTAGTVGGAVVGGVIGHEVSK